jgi:competence protein ComFC
MSFPANVKPWVDTALSFVFPDVCQICGANRAKKRDGYVCDSCREQVLWIEAPFCERCGLPFEGEITGTFECANCREMELHFKSARSAVRARGPVLDAIHKYKYNGQMWFEEFLAELFVNGARDWFREHSVDALLPVLPTPTQTRLSRSQRAENMRHAFALKREEQFKAVSFVLIDDVFTTGATTSACAKLLLKAGAEHVVVWTVARAEYHG